jgi:maleamate amidohydrolase
MKKPITLPRGKIAALFIDLQEEHRQDPRYLVDGFGDVVANAARLQQAARAAGAPLYHFAYVVDLTAGDGRPYHPVMPDGRSAFSDKDDPLTAICREVAPQDGEPLIVKSEATAFRDGLADELRGRGIEWLAIAGVWTEACVDATVKDAIGYGFRVLLVKDACGSGSRAMHQTGILNLANRLYGGAVVSTDAACRLLAGETAPAWQVEGAVPLRYEAETLGKLYAAL